MEEAKFCIDCKYQSNILGLIKGQSWCLRPSGNIDLTTGKVYTIISTTSYERYFETSTEKGNCGKSGIFFTPITSLWFRIKRYLSKLVE